LTSGVNKRRAIELETLIMLQRHVVLIRDVFLTLPRTLYQTTHLMRLADGNIGLTLVFVSLDGTPSVSNVCTEPNVSKLSRADGISISLIIYTLLTKYM